MRIPLYVEVVCRESVGEVVERIRGSAVWRESEMPDDLKRSGLLSFEVTIEGTRFRARFYAGSSPSGRFFTGSRYPQDDIRLIGRVESHPEGAVVRATARISRLIWIVPGFLTMISLQQLAQTGSLSLPVLLVASIVIAFAARKYFWRGRIESRILLFMMSRLDAALTDIEVRRIQYARHLG